MAQIQLIFLLVIITLVHSNTLPSKIEQHLPQASININDIVDALLPDIHKCILKNGMDPTKLVDFSENIFPHLPGKMKGNIDFRKGWMQNLSLLKRTGSVTVEYKDMLLTLNMNLGFDVLDVSYEYSLKHLLYKRRGDVYARFYNLEVNIIITIDLANYCLDLESIKFSTVRNYDIKFEGHLLDNILNGVTKLITLFFRKHILTGIEERSMMIFSAKIEEWNKIFPRSHRKEIIEKWFNISEIQFY